MTGDLYRELGVSADASPESIKKAHREAVRRLHPDNAETGDREAFERAQRAYTILSNAEARAHYDQTGEIDDAPDNSLSEIATIVVDAFNKAMSQIGASFRNVDVIDRTRKWVRSELVSVEHSVNAARSEIDITEQVLARLKIDAKSRFDPIGNSLRQRIQILRFNIEQNERQRALIEAAEACLDYYSFEHDPVTKVEEWLPASFTQTTAI